ncbi:SA1320 family protein [Peribacillus sp. SCS-37]|uniref:SA1320 family protein n=1 Tax=Paraperibacillus esterisolvens TaxID=3115296 RepID=UPI003905C8E0
MSAKIPVKRSADTDQDLVELAGYQAYLHNEVNSTFRVNGKDYIVADVKYNHPSGLDALTVMNLNSKEYTIVFVGTDAGAENGKQDIITDIQLMSRITPAQVQAAEDYYNEISAKGIDVNALCGNSLGGGLADAVGTRHPDVRTVTLNPALLPDGHADPDMDYKNITNYFSRYDVLTGGLSALHLDGRIPGSQFHINNGIPGFEYLTTNHTGYLKNEDGTQFYEIGVEGQAGYGRIYIDADAHIVTSVWTGQPLYGGRTDRIEINAGELDQLAGALKKEAAGRLGLAAEYLGRSSEIIVDEETRFAERVARLQDTFQELFENSVTDPIFQGITTTGYMFKAAIDALIVLLNTAEARCRFLNSLLNSPPAQVIEFVTSTSIDVVGFFGAARSFLEDIKDKIDELTGIAGLIITGDIPRLFKGGTDMAADAVVGELKSHYGIISRNKDKVQSHVSEFGQQVKDTGSAFHNRDQSLSGSIRDKSGLSPTDKVQGTNDYSLEDSPYLKTGMAFKEIFLESSYAALTGSVHVLAVIPLFTRINLLIRAAEEMLESISGMIKGAAKIAVYGTLPGLFMSLISDFNERIEWAIQDALRPLEELAATIEGLRKGVDQFILHFPEVIRNFRPYLDSALFENSKYFNVHLYNSAALAILEEMELLFGDIVYQLQGQKANAIDTLAAVSKKVLHNFTILEEQVDRGTLN